jgi:hypothetical protein
MVGTAHPADFDVFFPANLRIKFPIPSGEVDYFFCRSRKFISGKGLEIVKTRGTRLDLSGRGLYNPARQIGDFSGENFSGPSCVIPSGE